MEKGKCGEKKRKGKGKRKRILGRTLLNLPTPHFVVLYNGREKQPEVQTLRLSDAYEVRQESYELDLACTVYNINKSNNAWLLENCEALNGYMTFVEYVRKTYIGNDAEKMQECLTEATDYCIDNNILPDFFRKYKDQIVEVEMIDYSIEKMEYFAEKRGYDAGVAAGISQGISQGRAEMQRENDSLRDENEILRRELQKLRNENK